ASLTNQLFYRLD
ncbi:hypothetical protein D047_1107B, partial [Vibrio parahaemolyticus VPTS-2010_2]